ncbi:MAG: hypothetical protein IT169_05980 [Bryobacterales bacterium]|nr:hypothetical protein [Bryobacterales bacterium]
MRLQRIVFTMMRQALAAAAANGTALSARHENGVHAAGGESAEIEAVS